jgi:uncharacterized protein (TIGR02145 family)
MDYDNDKALWYENHKSYMYSVRCIQDNPSNGGSSSSSGGGGRGNNIANYKTVPIGTQVWMAENLDYAVDYSECYNNDCVKYGRLYEWAAAMSLPASCNSTLCASQISANHRGVCPAGWHVPSASDWDILMGYVETNNGNTYTPGSADIAGKYLKATNGWNDYNGPIDNYQDTYGFAALPGGYGYPSGGFGNAGYNGYWWSTSEESRSSARYRYMVYNNEEVNWTYGGKTFMYSVRCVQDGASSSSSSSGAVDIGGGKGNNIANYKTVPIGTQTWMVENLDYAVDGSKCYYNDPANCVKYGRLYEWATAMALSANCNSTNCASQISAKHRGICPVGWHIPTNAEWDKLFRYADGTSGTSILYDSETAGRYLKSRNGWNNGGNGEDTYGFAALPGGSYVLIIGSFGGAGQRSGWWSTSEYENSYAYVRGMSYISDRAEWKDEDKREMHSVRCVRD